MSVARGQVVALRREAVGIVWRVSAEEVLVVPIWGMNGPPRHRAEVPIDNLTDIIACGIGIKKPVVRCDLIHKVALSAVGALRGKAPAVLMNRIAAGVAKELAAQQDETRMHYNHRPSSAVLAVA